MSLSRRSKNKHIIDISKLYAIKPGVLWRQFRSEHLSFQALSLYFLFEYVRPQSIYPALDILPWAQLLLILAVVTAFTDKSVKWVGSPENKLLNIFSFILILSSLLAFNPGASWAMISIYVNWVLVYFLMINIVNTEKRLLIFFVLYLLFSFKMGQHGAISWASRGFSFANWGLIGAGGWFQNSGEFAIQMLIFTVLSLSFIAGLRKYWGKYTRLFFYLMPLSGALCIMGASSRGSQFALAVIAFTLLMKTKQKFKVIFVLIILSVLLLYLLPEEQLQRFINAGDDQTSLQRLVYWQYGMDMIFDHPVLGIGFYNWMNYLWYIAPGGVGVMDTVQLPHNIYIQVAAELGILGLIVFLLMAIFVFVINARTRSIAKKADAMLWYYISYGLDAGLVGYLVAGFFVTVFYYPFFWVQMGMAVMLNNVVNKLQVGQGNGFRSAANDN